MQQLLPATSAYHLHFCVRVVSEINIPAMKSALQHLVDRHSMLRTTFRCAGQQVEMVIHGAGEVEFHEVDASEWNDEELQQRAERSFRHPFDLQHGPLFRVHVFSRSATDHVLLFVLHHLVCDAWSIGIVLMGVYRVLSGASRRPLAPSASARRRLF